MKKNQNRYLISFIIILLAIGLLFYPKQSHIISPSHAITPTPTQHISTEPTKNLTQAPTAPVSVSDNVAGPGEHCGGFIMNAKHCQTGYHCKLNKIADTGGVCVVD